MDSELPAVNTAQLETPVFHRDHNEPPSSQQSVTNRCSTSRSFDQNFAQLPSVEVPLGTPIRSQPYAEPCTIITDVNHMTILTTHWRLRSKCLLEVKGIQTSLAQCQWCSHTLIPRFFIEIKLPASPLIIMMITLPMEQNSVVFFFSTFRINSFKPAFINFVMGNTSVHAAVGDCHQAGISSTEPPTESSSENMAKRVIPANNDSQTEVRFLLF